MRQTVTRGPTTRVAGITIVGLIRCLSKALCVKKAVNRPDAGGLQGGAAV